MANEIKHAGPPSGIFAASPPACSLQNHQPHAKRPMEWSLHFAICCAEIASAPGASAFRRQHAVASCGLRASKRGRGQGTCACDLECASCSFLITCCLSARFHSPASSGLALASFSQRNLRQVSFAYALPEPTVSKLRARHQINGHAGSVDGPKSMMILIDELCKMRWRMK